MAANVINNMHYALVATPLDFGKYVGNQYLWSKPEKAGNLVDRVNILAKGIGFADAFGYTDVGVRAVAALCKSFKTLVGALNLVPDAIRDASEPANRYSNSFGSRFFSGTLNTAKFGQKLFDNYKYFKDATSSFNLPILIGASYATGVSSAFGVVAGTLGVADEVNTIAHTPLFVPQPAFVGEVLAVAMVQPVVGEAVATALVQTAVDETLAAVPAQAAGVRVVNLAFVSKCWKLVETISYLAVSALTVMTTFVSMVVAVPVVASYVFPSLLLSALVAGVFSKYVASHVPAVRPDIVVALPPAPIAPAQLAQAHVQEAEAPGVQVDAVPVRLVAHGQVDPAVAHTGL